MRKKRHKYYVYIVASTTGTLYIGMTNNLRRRIKEHKENKIEGFSKKYNCNRLVFYESSQYVDKIINREKQLKRWSRRKKEWLIKTINPHWKDLYEDLF